MKIILISILISFAASSVAATKFECKLDTDSKNKFSFSVENLETKDVAFVPFADEELGPVKSSAKDSSVTRDVVDTLNGQGGDVRTNSKGLFLFGDAVGCVFVDFQLYKNKAYKRGYVKMSFHCDDELKDVYSLVSCSVK